MSDLDKIQQSINEHFANTNKKIESIDDKITDIRTDVTAHSERINQLETYASTDDRRITSIETQIEFIKQDRLRNNLRLTGLPPEAFANPIETVMKIIDAVQINLLPSDFVAYVDQKKSSIIVQFDKHSHKRIFMDGLRQRKVLLVEEVLHLQSSSKIYCNDQLTPYFASLFNIAWNAKKSNQLFSASSLGGRVKVRKNENSSLVLIETKTQLIDIIGDSQSEEMSSNTTSGSPNSSSNEQQQPKQQEIQQERPPQQNRTQNHQPAIQRSSTQIYQREQRDSNRPKQWQGMRHNPNNQFQQQKTKTRFKHQDSSRHLDLSPTQYQTNYNRPTNQKPESYGHRNTYNRNYSSRRFNERY